MKTINLTNVPIRPSLAAPEVKENLGKQIADVIYQKSKSYAEFEFGKRLYFAEGDIEVSDEEIGYIKDAMAGFFYWAQVAILKALGEEEA